MKITSKTRNVLIIVGIAGVAGSTVIIFINKAAKNKVLSQINEILGKAQGANTAAQASNDLNSMVSQGINPSFPDSQYAVWADSLFECFDGWGTCTSYLPIFQSLQNNADFLKLVQAFGTKKVSSGAGNPAPDVTGDLATQINSELSSSEIATINQAMADNGITYSF